MIAFPNIKINLGLSITEKRPDGYHNLETVFYPVASKTLSKSVLLLKQKRRLPSTSMEWR